MIKFFRKVRQKMLTENKFSKYLIYAIGEIILVVIGILIALQINNWNQEKINNTTVNNYLIRISNEINLDIESYKKLHKEFKDQNEKLERLLKTLNSKPFVIHDSKQFKDDFFSVNGISPWFKEPIAWTQLIQSGELKLVKNQQLIELLMQHYARVEKSANDYNQFPTQIMIDSRKLLSAAIANRNESGLDDKELLNEGTYQYIIENKQKFKELIVRMKIISNNYSFTMNKHAESGIELLQFLNQSIAK